MKRFIAMLLLVTLLCGCSATQAPSVMQEPPFEKETIQGGILVHTDYSKYGPQVVPERKYTRLSPEFISELQPSDDYGMLYPFVGGVSNDSYDTYLQYGMVDKNGRIVVDAVYSRIEPVRHDYNSTAEQIPMWTLGTITESDSWGELCYALAAFDGSFVTEQIYTYVRAYEEYVLAEFVDAQGTQITHVYDKHGNLCLDSSDWALSERIASNPVGYGGGTSGIRNYGNGLFCVDLGKGMYYADWDGNLIAGPYTYGEAFSDGYALVHLGLNAYIYIDTEGNKLLDMDFYHAESFVGGFAAASISETEQVLISAKDGIILRCEGYHSDIRESTFCVWNDKDVFYNLNGELLFASPEDFASYELLGDGKFVYNYQSGVIFNTETGKELQGDGHNQFEYYDAPASILYHESFLSGESVDYIYYIVDEDLNLLYEITDDVVDHTKDVLTGQGYYRSRMYGQKITKLYGSQWENPLELQGEFDRIFGGRIVCYDELGSYQYDMKGNMVFCYLYFAGNGD